MNYLYFNVTAMISVGSVWPPVAETDQNDHIFFAFYVIYIKKNILNENTDTCSWSQVPAALYF